MTPEAPPERSAATIYLSKWSESSDTYKTMRGALESVVTALGERGVAVEDYPWHELRYETVRGVAARLKKKKGKSAPMGPQTINKVLVALRGVLESAWRSGMLPDEEYRRIKVESVRGSGLAAGRALRPEELDAVAACLSRVDARDAALIAVLAGAGVRRIEVVQLVREDYDPQTGRLIATGKGQKKRPIPVGNRWRPVIETWRATLAPGALMFDFGGKDPRRQVSYVVESFCAVCGITPFTPHDLRRTFATHVIKATDIAVAQRLLGHSNMQTTGIYDRRGEDVEDAAVKDL
jgi:integrase